MIRMMKVLIEWILIQVGLYRIWFVWLNLQCTLGNYNDDKASLLANVDDLCDVNDFNDEIDYIMQDVQEESPGNII